MSTVFLAMYFANQMRSKQVAEPLKTVIITGGSRGIGLAAAKQLAATGRWNVVLACRSLVQAEEAIKGITNGREYVSAVELDLSKLASVRRFTSYWGDRSLHCLALNAGIHGGSKTMPEWSEDGHELTVATNHIGHFLLTSLLRKNVEKARAGRIVYVASSLHDGGSGSSMLGDLRGLQAGFKAPHCTISGRPFNGDKVYRDSKLCNVMTTLELARRLQTQGSKVTCNALAPGFIPTTGLFRSYPSFVMSLFTFVMRDVLGIAVTEEEGGRRLAYMIDSPDLEGVSGAYYATNKKTRTFEAVLPSEEARDVNKAAKLWHLTEKLLEEHGRDEQ